MSVDRMITHCVINFRFSFFGSMKLKQIFSTDLWWSDDTRSSGEHIWRLLADWAERFLAQYFCWHYLLFESCQRERDIVERAHRTFKFFQWNVKHAQFSNLNSDPLALTCFLMPKGSIARDGWHAQLLQLLITYRKCQMVMAILCNEWVRCV